MEKLGWLLTIIWILLFTCLIIFRLDDAVTMTLNEWGDFFAGFAAPLALLWLIVGYRLQKNELTMNTKALETQKDELSKQVNELIKQNEILQQQKSVFEKSIDATHQLASAVDNISDTYDGWRRHGT